MNMIVHWLAKIFRGRVVEESEIDSGTVRRFRSGYIEHIDKETKSKTDVLLDLHNRTHGPRTWKCCRIQGGGTVEYENVNKAQAMARCTRELGPIVYVDEDHGFVFYRDGTAPAGSVTLPVNR